MLPAEHVNCAKPGAHAMTQVPGQLFNVSFHVPEEVKGKREDCSDRKKTKCTLAIMLA